MKDITLVLAVDLHNGLLLGDRTDLLDQGFPILVVSGSVAVAPWH